MDIKWHGKRHLIKTISENLHLFLYQQILSQWKCIQIHTHTHTQTHKHTLEPTVATRKPIWNRRAKTEAHFYFNFICLYFSWKQNNTYRHQHQPTHTRTQMWEKKEEREKKEKLKHINTIEEKWIEPKWLQAINKETTLILFFRLFVCSYTVQAFDYSFRSEAIRSDPGSFGSFIHSFVRLFVCAHKIWTNNTRAPLHKCAHLDSNLILTFDLERRNVWCVRAFANITS